MSVHAEYGRALEALLERVRALSHPRAESWMREIEAARIGGHPDLSSAASAALRLASEIATDSAAGRVEGLVAPLAHLKAHCRAILGREEP